MLKLELEKAYDKVDWDYLIQTLQLFNFPQATIKLVHACINSTSLAGLWNGERTNDFQPTRGL